MRLMKRYVWHTGKSYDELLKLLRMNTYTGLSKFELVEIYKKYRGMYGLYSNVKGRRLTVVICEDEADPWYSFRCPIRYFKGKLIEQDGKITVTGHMAFSSFKGVMFAYLAIVLFTGDYLNLEKYAATFILAMSWWLGTGLYGCFVYRKTEKHLIEELSALLSPDVQESKENAAAETTDEQ